jgi:hypothetical protein
MFTPQSFIGKETNALTHTPAISTGGMDAKEFCVGDWLREVGLALLKGRRQSIDVLPAGAARVVVEYPSLGALLGALQQLDALMAMVQESAGSLEDRSRAARSARSPRRPPKRR